MSRNRGRRYDDTPKLNMKKVIALIVAIIVIIMFIISLKNLLVSKEKNTKEVSTLTTYITIYENNKWGVIDNKGNKVIEPIYDEMIIIPNKNKDLFICTYDVNQENETYQTKILNAEGKEILTDYQHIEALENQNDTKIWYEADVLKYENNNHFGIINFEGKEILPAEYDAIYALEGTDHSIIVEKDGAKGVFSNKTGEMIINADYADITSFGDSYENGYIVKTANNQYGVIGIDKKTILDAKYDEIKNITGNNYYVVRENNQLEIIDNTGNVVLDKGFDSVESINATNFVIIKDSKYGVISKTGEIIIPAEYEDLEYIFTNYYIAKKNGKYGVIATDGTTIIDYTYEKMSYIKTADFIEAENEDYTTDIFDSSFHKVLESVIVSDLNIDDGYLRIRKSGEYQYYNFKFEEKTNKEVLATNTLFLFRENGKYGYQNKNGDIIVDAIYDDAKEQNEFGYCAVNKDGLWGALKSDGTVVVTPSVNLQDYLYVDFISEWHRHSDLNLNIYTK